MVQRIYLCLFISSNDNTTKAYERDNNHVDVNDTNIYHTQYHLVRIDQDVDSRGESKDEMAELDRDPTPQRFVGQLSVFVRLSAGEDIMRLCGGDNH